MPTYCLFLIAHTCTPTFSLPISATLLTHYPHLHPSLLLATASLVSPYESLGTIYRLLNIYHVSCEKIPLIFLIFFFIKKYLFAPSLFVCLSISLTIFWFSWRATVVTVLNTTIYQKPRKVPDTYQRTLRHFEEWVNKWLIKETWFWHKVNNIKVCNIIEKWASCLNIVKCKRQ